MNGWGGGRGGGGKGRTVNDMELHWGILTFSSGHSPSSYRGKVDQRCENMKCKRLLRGRGVWVGYVGGSVDGVEVSRKFEPYK